VDVRDGDEARWRRLPAQRGWHEQADQQECAGKPGSRREAW
jgi:hypothetical protein